MYADRETDSMKKAIGETRRRRALPGGPQHEARHHPQDHPEGDRRIWPAPPRTTSSIPSSYKPPKEGQEGRSPPSELPAPHRQLKQEMFDLAEALEFEKAAAIRDRIKDLEQLALAMM